MRKTQSFKIFVISNCNLNPNKIDQAFVPVLNTSKQALFNLGKQNCASRIYVRAAVSKSPESLFYFYHQIYFG